MTPDIAGYGVDINEVVVERCRARGLDVRAADALVHLREVPEGSVRAVTSFHVVEHLSLDTLVQLIDAALVALKAGGLLIFETPNPTNINVGAASFYLDPTHLKPLHPQFLRVPRAVAGLRRGGGAVPAPRGRTAPASSTTSPPTPIRYARRPSSIASTGRCSARSTTPSSLARPAPSPAPDDGDPGRTPTDLTR